MVDNTQKTDAAPIIPEANAAPAPAPTAPVAPKNDAPVAKAKSANKVEIDANVLKSLLDRVENLTQTVKEHEQSFGQDQMAKIERLRASGKLVKNVRLNFFENKLVKSWYMIKDDVFIDTLGKEQAVQQIALVFKDGEEQQLPMVEFMRRKLQREYEVIREARESDGSITLTVLLDGNEEFSISSTFVN